MNELGNKYYPLPQPEEIPTREREDAMGAYLMMFASLAAGLPLPIINLIASIIYYYINKSKSKFVHFHALQSLYSQIPTSLINAGLVFWTIRIVIVNDVSMSQTYKGYIVMAIIANLIYFIFSIIASIKARKGNFYYFILFGKLAYHHVYVIRSELDTSGKILQNKPPSSLE